MDWWVWGLASLASYVLIIIYLSWRNPEPHSTWQQIELEQLKFPSNFNWGSATAAHQIEGNNTNNWSSFEERTGIEKSAKACEHWQRWREDFNLLSELGVDSYRFSIQGGRELLLSPCNGLKREGSNHHPLNGGPILTISLMQNTDRKEPQLSE